MSISEFKVIFFWEYIHRFWARFMGIVFAVPFLWFLWNKQFPKWLIKRLGIVVSLAAAAATFGWIMVASGLNDDTRTWVSAYKLIIHLGLASTLLGYLFWTYLLAAQPQRQDCHFAAQQRFGIIVTFVLVVQILFGGLMAGMRAGLIHPYFPLFVEGNRFWSIFSDTSQFNLSAINDYESSLYIKGIVQILHRSTAYILVSLLLLFIVRLVKKPISARLFNGSVSLGVIVGIQFFLGVLTIVNSIGNIPVAYGSIHQGVALLLFLNMLFVLYQMTPNRTKYIV
jgi:cytochrome c oxidase assembly protein subunit 15